jgi:hypothetical protein
MHCKLSSQANLVFLAPCQGGAGLEQLEALSLTGVQLSADMVAQVTRYTALQELTAGRTARAWV